MDLSELIKGGFKECWDFDGLEEEADKTDQQWSEELSELQRDAERYRWLIQQVGKVKLHTGTFGGCAKMLDIGDELSEYIDFRIDSYLSGEDW
jgi:hypothetical protein